MDKTLLLIREMDNRTGDDYQTGDANQLLSDGVYNYEYDGEGNRTRRVEIATSAATGYEWDYRNRLTRVSFENSAGVVTEEIVHTYDAYGESTHAEGHKGISGVSHETGQNQKEDTQE